MMVSMRVDNTAVATISSHFLTSDEEEQLLLQFRSRKWSSDRQVFWHGIMREEAQKWADEHGYQTLSTAMGPLRDREKEKANKARSRYMKGASTLFSYIASQSRSVVVLCPPPPHRFHPSRLTSFQEIEEPILKGIIGTSKLSSILMVHPLVRGAEGFFYEYWPLDESHKWIENFGLQTAKRRQWRPVKTIPSILIEPQLPKRMWKAKEKIKTKEKVKAKKKIKAKEKVKTKEKKKTKQKVKAKEKVKTKEKKKTKQKVKGKEKVKAKRKPAQVLEKQSADKLREKLHFACEASSNLTALQITKVRPHGFDGSLEMGRTKCIFGDGKMCENKKYAEGSLAKKALLKVQMESSEAAFCFEWLIGNLQRILCCSFPR